MPEFLRRSPLTIAVLISGGGTTLANLIDKIAARELDARIDLVISSAPDAKGLVFAEQAGIPSLVIAPRDFGSVPLFSAAVFDACRAAGVHLVVMGGFLRLVQIPTDFQLRVVNIHPALIPAFCGRGYYGLKIHQAVLDYGAKISGCTVHFVDDQYDHGPIILQRAVSVADDDTAESLAARVFAAECEAYPQALGLIASGRIAVHDRRVTLRPS